MLGLNKNMHSRLLRISLGFMIATGLGATAVHAEVFVKTEDIVKLMQDHEKMVKKGEYKSTSKLMGSLLENFKLEGKTLSYQGVELKSDQGAYFDVSPIGNSNAHVTGVVSDLHPVLRNSNFTYLTDYQNGGKLFYSPDFNKIFNHYKDSSGNFQDYELSAQDINGDANLKKFLLAHGFKVDRSGNWTGPNGQRLVFGSNNSGGNPDFSSIRLNNNSSPNASSISINNGGGRGLPNSFDAYSMNNAPSGYNIGISNSGGGYGNGNGTASINTSAFDSILAAYGQGRGGNLSLNLQSSGYGNGVNSAGNIIVGLQKAGYSIDPSLAQALQAALQAGDNARAQQIISQIMSGNGGQPTRLDIQTQLGQSGANLNDPDVQALLKLYGNGGGAPNYSQYSLNGGNLGVGYAAAPSVDLKSFLKSQGIDLDTPQGLKQLSIRLGNAGVSNPDQVAQGILNSLNGNSPINSDILRILGFNSGNAPSSNSSISVPNGATQSSVTYSSSPIAPMVSPETNELQVWTGPGLGDFAYYPLNADHTATLDGSYHLGKSGQWEKVGSSKTSAPSTSAPAAGGVIATNGASSETVEDGGIPTDKPIRTMIFETYDKLTEAAQNFGSEIEFDGAGGRFVGGSADGRRIFVKFPKKVSAKEMQDFINAHSE